MIYEIYSDGSSLGNPSPHCGCGWVILKDKKLINMNSEYIPDATNNIAEMRGVINGLEEVNKLIEENNSFEMHEIIVYSDSAYIVNCINNKWFVNWNKNNWRTSKGTPVKNKELWEKILELYDPSTTTFKKVKGHSGNEYNEMADSLATNASRSEGRDIIENC